MTVGVQKQDDVARVPVEWEGVPVDVSVIGDIVALADIPTGDDAKKLLLGTAAVAGGIVLGAAAAGSFTGSWVADYGPERVPGLGEQLATFGAWNLAMVLLGGALSDGIDQYGARSVMLGLGGFAAFIGIVKVVKG